MDTLILIKVFILLANIFVVLEAIRNGYEAPVNAAPFMVGLLGKDTKWHFCGGAIVAKRWIATAHHCIKDRNKDEIVGAVGSVIRKQGIYYDIEDIVSHPDYPNSDLALLKTTTEIAFTKGIRKIPLAKALIPAYQRARIYGWGRTSVSTECTCICL